MPARACTPKEARSLRLSEGSIGSGEAKMGRALPRRGPVSRVAVPCAVAVSAEGELRLGTDLPRDPFASEPHPVYHKDGPGGKGALAPLPPSSAPAEKMPRARDHNI